MAITEAAWNLPGCQISLLINSIALWEMEKHLRDIELEESYILCMNHISSFERFIHLCGRHGMDMDKLRQFMDYMISADFILSGRDRHLGNVSVLRDAESLQFIAPAPIYDSGKCLFVQNSVPANDRETYGENVPYVLKPDGFNTYGTVTGYRQQLL